MLTSIPAIAELHKDGGDTELNLLLERGVELEGGEIRFLGVRGEYNYFVTQGFGIGLTAAIRSFSGARQGETAEATSVSLTYNVRWVALTYRKIKIFFDAGLGGNVSSTSFPPQGTKYNAEYFFGVGGSRLLGLGTTFTFGARLFHISNGRGLVPDNPALDAAIVSVGVGW